MANNKRQANIGAWDAMMAKVAGQPEIERLRTENQRLRADNAKLEASVDNAARIITEMWSDITAMRPIVEALAKWGIGGGLPVEFYHQARAFVAAHPATATATGKAESGGE